VARLRDLGAPTIFLRLGRRGSIAITAAGAAFVPSVAVTAVDVTGGGNAYSGGALAALAAGDDAVTAAHKGTVSAALCVSQRGVFSPRAPLAAMQAQQFLSALKPEPLT
jgi:sugar/nucleoside kinase (ribokinase family)